MILKGPTNRVPYVERRPVSRHAKRTQPLWRCQRTPGNTRGRPQRRRRRTIGTRCMRPSQLPGRRLPGQRVVRRPPERPEFGYRFLVDEAAATGQPMATCTGWAICRPTTGGAHSASLDAARAAVRVRGARRAGQSSVQRRGAEHLVVDRQLVGQAGRLSRTTGDAAAPASAVAHVRRGSQVASRALTIRATTGSMACRAGARYFLGSTTFSSPVSRSRTAPVKATLRIVPTLILTMP